MATKPERRFKVVADNRKARFNYAIGEVFEAGVLDAKSWVAREPLASVSHRVRVFVQSQ